VTRTTLDGSPVTAAPGGWPPSRAGVRVGVLVALVLVAGSCDFLLTEAPPAGDVLDAPLPGLTAAELRAFAAGDEAFEASFSPALGLGPLFTNVSCASCHSGDGRGRPEPAFSNLVPRVDPVEALSAGLSYEDAVIQRRGLPGVEPESVPSGIGVSFRLPPPVFGVGLIEAIPEADILSREDPLDADGDGISGRANRVTLPEWLPSWERPGGASPRVGRFTRRGRVASVFQQVAEAYLNDVGITTDLLVTETRNLAASVPTASFDRVPDPELPLAVVEQVTFYLRTLAPPEPGPMTAARERGEALFHGAGCAACHTPEMVTGPHAVSALSGRPVRLYSDLLLHDMGDGLADGVADGDASGREWRTAPLWGLRLIREFLDGDAFLLHDGRARSLEEAILLHGGEAQAARDGFADLGPADRADLLDFVGSR
jgi:CxxC motif-containing protein (DUF1111 family)